MSYSLCGQIIISAGLDPKMAMEGSSVYSPTSSLDVTLKLIFQKKNYELGLIAEYCDIKYVGYGVFANYLIPFKLNSDYVKLELATGLEGGKLYRYNLEENKDSYWTYGINGEIRYFLTKSFGIALTANMKTREDLPAQYPTEEHDKFRFNGTVSFLVRL